MLKRYLLVVGFLAVIELTTCATHGSRVLHHAEPSKVVFCYEKCFGWKKLICDIFCGTTINTNENEGLQKSLPLPRGKKNHPAKKVVDDDDDDDDDNNSDHGEDISDEDDNDVDNDDEDDDRGFDDDKNDDDDCDDCSDDDDDDEDNDDDDDDDDDYDDKKIVSVKHKPKNQPKIKPKPKLKRIFNNHKYFN